MSNLDDYYKKYNHSKPKTNADCIRAMTDEELAAWLADHPLVSEYDENNPRHKAWFDWLKQDYTTFVAQEYEKDLNDRLNREGISP